MLVSELVANAGKGAVEDRFGFRQPASVLVEVAEIVENLLVMWSVPAILALKHRKALLEQLFSIIEAPLQPI